MAFSYTWGDAIAFLKSYVRNIPLDKLQEEQADAVSAEMWRAYPWPDTCQNIPPVPLVDSVQDYSSPPTFFRLVGGQIIRTAPSALQFEALSVTIALPEQTIPVTPAAIRYFAMQRGIGLLRLQFPPAINTNEAYELHGTYQLQHARVTSLNTQCWFDDSLWHVAQEGLLYWGYKLGNQARNAIDQYKVFKGKIIEAWQQVNQGSGDILVPEVTFGDWG